MAGLWPDAMNVYAFFLMLKPTGTFRTIGLLPGLYRIWARTRMPLVRAWGAGVPRCYFAAGVGKSTVDAVGRTLLIAEGLDDDEEAACFIADIDKCYEHVNHTKLVHAAHRHNFPMGILRLCIAMYRAARTISWDGVFAVASGEGPSLTGGGGTPAGNGEFVYASRSLVPGCSIALWLLQLVMLTPLDEFMDSMPRQVKNTEVYVDDATVQAVGRKGTVAGLAVKAARALFDAFQEGAELPISHTKGRVVGSTPAVAKRVETALKAKGYKAVQAMTVLGVDTGAGKGGLHGQARARMKAAEKRKSRFLCLRRLGAKTAGLVRSALPPAVTYGAKVIGLPPPILRRLRTLMRVGLPGRAKSASLTLQYATSKSLRDPSIAVIEAPIVYWAKLAFGGGEDSRKAQQKAWQKQVPRLGKASRPWAKVAG